VPIANIGVPEDSVEFSGLSKAEARRKTEEAAQRGYAVSRLRPLARLALMTFRPPRVAMRERNPCRRLRFKLLGWKVLFMRSSPIHFYQHSPS
jgi:hypothetical protein